MGKKDENERNRKREEGKFMIRLPEEWKPLLKDLAFEESSVGLKSSVTGQVMIAVQRYLIEKGKLNKNGKIK